MKIKQSGFLRKNIETEGFFSGERKIKTNLKFQKKEILSDTEKNKKIFS